MDISSRTTLSAPWVSAESFWPPVHLVESAWLEHAPFAAWLIAALRPKQLVELGTHNGFSFFTFCEAARRLETGTVLHAIDTWQGDEHAGFYGEEVYGEVSRIRDEFYPESALLHRGYFEDFVASFPDRSIDVLHIDGRHGYEDVLDDYSTWLPKLSEQGVVLFHDIAERDRGFGVWKLWDELVAQLPHASFGFEHGHGLGVLVPSGKPPKQLAPLFGASEEQRDEIRKFYSEQGAWIGEAFSSKQAHVSLARHAENLERALSDTRAELARVLDSAAWRVTRPLRAMADVLKHRSPGAASDSVGSPSA